MHIAKAGRQAKYRKYILDVYEQQSTLLLMLCVVLLLIFPPMPKT